MILRIGNLSVGGKRVLTILLVVVVYVFLLSAFHTPYPVAEYQFSSVRPFRPVFSGTVPLKFSTFRYEFPQDLIVPQWQGRDIETESVIGKVTILFHGRDPTYIRAIQTHQVHNRHHGYPLLALRHAILDGIWSKPAYILAVLLEELRKPDGQRLKWLLCVYWCTITMRTLTMPSWVDADTVITNPKIPLEIFLPPEEFPHLHLLVTADPHGLNNGIFFIKVHSWSVQLLSAVIAYPTFRPGADLKYRDQTALEEILKERAFKENFAILPQRWINAYQAERDWSRKHRFQVLPGDLLVHFPGVPQRDERMRFYLDMAERHWPKWEMDLDSTTYPTEIKEYWIEQQGILAKGRTLAQQTASEVREFYRKCQNELTEYRDRLDSAELEAIEKDMKAMGDALEDDRDNRDIVKEATDRLQRVSMTRSTFLSTNTLTPEQSTASLRRLIEEPKKALLNEAKGLISQCEQLLSQRSADSKITDKEVSELKSQRDVLQHLVTEAPDDQGAIRQAVRDLRKGTMEAKSKMDEVPADAKKIS